MELLAPAGSRGGFRAALAAGADAVYLGAPGCNARSLSRDFSYQEVDALVREGHAAGCRVYIAMNSLVKEGELPQVLTTLSRFEEIGPDALIIQDLGLLHLCRRYFPSLSLHASTLMSVHNSRNAEWLAASGCSRVVLARELSLEEIRTIGASCRAEMEVFVHGAMCFSYSGLCLFSSLHGGRSSLRGRCVQPCRRKYRWAGQKRRKASGYFFSMNDLCGIDLLPELRRAGVVSLKIEGRLKSVEYVRNTVRAYRLALDSLDAASADRRAALAEASRMLQASLGRKTCSGFFVKTNGQGVINPELSGNTGQLVGKVRRLTRLRQTETGQVVSSLEVVLQTGLQKGDRLRLHGESSGERVACTLRGLSSRGRMVHRARSGERVACLVPLDLARFQNERIILFKVDVRQRRQREEKTTEASHPLPPLPASARTLHATVCSQLGLRCSTQPPGRRRKGTRHRPGQGREPAWWVRIRSLHGLHQRLPVRPEQYLLPLNRENMTLYGQFLRFRNRIVWALPPVIDQERCGWFSRQIQALHRAGFRRFQVAHIGQSRFFRDAAARGIVLFGDYTLNVLNSAALHHCVEHGLSAVQFSLETDRQNLSSSLAHFRHVHGKDRRSLRIGIYVFGRPPLFTARFRGQHLRYHRPLYSPRGEEILLDRDDGVTHARSARPFSLLAHRKELQQLGIDYFVVDLSGAGFKNEVGILKSCLRHSGGRMETMNANFAGTLV